MKLMSLMQQSRIKEDELKHLLEMEENGLHFWYDAIERSMTNETYEKLPFQVKEFGNAVKKVLGFQKKLGR